MRFRPWVYLDGVMPEKVVPQTLLRVKIFIAPTDATWESIANVAMELEMKSVRRQACKAVSTEPAQ